MTVSTANANFPGTGSIIYNYDDQITYPITVTGDYPTLTGITMQIGGINATVGTTTLSGIISGPSV